MWRGARRLQVQTVSPRQLMVTRCPSGEEEATYPHCRRELKPRSWGQGSVLFVSTQHTSHPVSFLGALSCWEGPQGRVLGGSEARGGGPLSQLCAYPFYILGSDSGYHLKKLFYC